jgi:hypothetical protein
MLILLWLSREDSAVWPAIVIAAGLAALTTLLTVVRFKAGAHLSGIRLVYGAGLFGGFSGMLTAPLAVALMLFKTAQHGHASPDFPFEIMGATLQRLLAWTAAGALFGVSIGLVIFAFGHKYRALK